MLFIFVPIEKPNQFIKKEAREKRKEKRESIMIGNIFHILKL